jgi:hypothetical protein
MAIMMVLTGDCLVMARFAVIGPLRTIGWLATAAIA